MKSIRPRRIPTILALFLLVLGIGLTVFLVKQGTFVVSQAAPDHTPQNVVISNVTDTSFTVSFWTKDPSVAVVQIEGGDSYVNTLSSSEAAVTHVFDIENLQASSEYGFSIISNEETYTDSGAAYKARTAPVPPLDIPEIPPLSGQVLLPAGGGAGGAVVYLSIEDSQIISTITNSSGEYVFNFPQGIRTRDLRGFYILEDGDFLALVSRLGELSSQVSAPYRVVLPTITLSHNFAFDTEQSVATPSSGILETNPLPSSGGLVVFSPLEGSSLIDSQPTFTGTGVPSSRVVIVIDKSSTSGNVLVDSSGYWEYPVPNPLSQGQHSASVQGVGANGVSQTKIINFQVFPSGSQVTDTATPSATPIPTTTSAPTPTSTPVPTLEPTVPTTTPPVGGVSPTPVVTASPTATVTPTPTITPFLSITPTAPGEVGGVILTFASLAFIVTGAALLFLLG